VEAEEGESGCHDDDERKDIVRGERKPNFRVFDKRGGGQEEYLYLTRIYKAIGYISNSLRSH
jgi:hypothetical protein